MQRENPIVKQVGTFTQALYDEAKKNGWTLISDEERVEDISF